MQVIFITNQKMEGKTETWAHSCVLVIWQIKCGGQNAAVSL